MKKFVLVPLILVVTVICGPASASAQAGIYVGLQAGYSAQKPSLKGVEFNTDTTFLYGVRAGIKFLMLGVELNYFQAAHNIELKDLLVLNWDGREVDYSYLGVNAKYIFSIFMVHPYLTFGYGYYTADIHEIAKDKNGGFNLGAGVELMLGNKFSVTAEAKYHHVKLDIEKRDLGLGDFTLSGGINVYF